MRLTNKQLARRATNIIYIRGLSPFLKNRNEGENGMTNLTIKRKGHTRRAYLRKDGVRVKSAQVAPATFKSKDTGAPGRTPKKKQWFEPQVETGWEKGQPEGVRRNKVLRAHKGNELASARAMQALSNVSTDRATSRAAGRDARFFFRRHNVRITPKRPKLKR